MSRGEAIHVSKERGGGYQEEVHEKINGTDTRFHKMLLYLSLFWLVHTPFSGTISLVAT